VSGTLPCRADTQCRPRFGDIWRCRRHVADMSPTCGAKSRRLRNTVHSVRNMVALQTPIIPMIAVSTRQTVVRRDSLVERRSRTMPLCSLRRSLRKPSRCWIRCLKKWIDSLPRGSRRNLKATATPEGVGRVV